MAREAAEHLGFPLEDAEGVVQGCGNVGSVAARMLDERGCKVIGVSDAAGGVYSRNGLNTSASSSERKVTLTSPVRAWVHGPRCSRVSVS